MSYYALLVAMAYYGLTLSAATINSSDKKLISTYEEYNFYSGISGEELELSGRELPIEPEYISPVPVQLIQVVTSFAGVSPLENRTIDLPHYYSGEGSSGGFKDGNSNNSHRGTVEGLCGYPPYCDRKKCRKLDYNNQTLGECRIKEGEAMFTFAISLLGICIISANLLLPIVVLKNNSMRTQYNYIKVSLAFADILRGILLLTAVLSYVGKFENMSENEAVDYVTRDTNSTIAIMVGSLLTLSTESSLLHLMFLSIERFIAIKWPFCHLKRKSKTVTMTIVAIWAISTVCCFIPAAFPDYFKYQFQPVLLIHMVTSASRAGDNFNGILYGVVVMVLPYSATVVFCVLTGVTSYVKIKSRTYKFGSEGCKVETSSSGAASRNSEKDGLKKQSTNNHLKPEFAVFLTIVIMIVAFTITLLPFGIVVILFTINVLQCSNYTYPYVFAFYAGMSNSLANAIIYTIRDGRFRTAVRQLFYWDKKSRPGTVKTLSTSAS